ncbi:MAG: Lrp/AsnC ligand binding domain-containing protein [Bacteroidaceae bacterium]|nr:Lrp/AsnC ligand binding domain-containing protein [Bacteroidaceae bacterium]
MSVKIDNLDLRIMQIISSDARIPLSDVAIKCGVSRAVVHQRIAKLTEKGAVLGSGYHVNPKSIGYSTCTFVGVNLEKGSMYNDVVECLCHIPEIVECHFTTGNFTMMIKLYAYDNEHLMDLLNNKIQQIPGVTSTETLISLQQSISRQLPIVFPQED